MDYGILKFDEPDRDTSRKIIHIDMDAFYASVERREDPSLEGKPVVIARHPKDTEGRGVVTTASYEARQFGIHSAMSAAKAYELCPTAVFIPPNFTLYREISAQIHNIFEQYTDLVQPLSLDEAYLDVTDNKYNLPSATIIARQLQQKIYDQTKLTCSAGVSYNKFIAKIASDYQKPSGLTVVPPELAECFLMKLPIEKFFGVGEKTLEKMHTLDIYTGEDLYQQSLDDLMQVFGKMGYSLYHKVRGIDNSPVIANRTRKSVGKESTYAHMMTHDDEVIQQLRRLSQQTFASLEKHHLHGKTVVLKYRYSNFSTHTKRKTLFNYIHSAQDLFNIASDIWYEEGEAERGIRLLGVTVTNLNKMSYENMALPLHHSKRGDLRNNDDKT
ncbi:DNA polymerase IV [Dolosigranulum savutiense]|uniref:DNA polymerase IV n=1 Tax=Dolosigranulum savutiense TaxID=3110288 RepID=A0AB74TKL5_9LACT